MLLLPLIIQIKVIICKHAIKEDKKNSSTNI